MPSHKGVKLSVISQWELQVHPEFAHPESSQFTYRSPHLNHSPLIEASPLSESSESKADKLLGRPSTVAVYIPSVSGARFWLRYDVLEAAATLSPWYFFKLYLNGRLITSWGVNSILKPNGQVMRGLFDPSEIWNYEDNGIVFKNNGTESRPFFFTKEDDNRSVRSAAEDGGLIEVQVFRARGRRRRMPKPEEFRSQDKWGIVMPSGGLLDKPQDAKYFDWHLKDPKDKPWASFQFHYRSWETLISQQLVPANHSRRLLTATPSLLSLNGLPRDIQNASFGEADGHDLVPYVEPEHDEYPMTHVKIQVNEVEEDEQDETISSYASNTPWMTSVFDDSPDHGARNPRKPAALFEGRNRSSYNVNKLDEPASLVYKIIHPSYGVKDKSTGFPSVFDDSPDYAARNPERPIEMFIPDYKDPEKPAPPSGLRRTTSTYPLRITNEMLVPTSKFSEPVQMSPVNMFGILESPESPDSLPRRWGDYRERPLPEILPRNTSLNKTGHHTRNSSILSNAASITPSLRSYCERNTASPDLPEIGVAKVLPVVASTFGLNHGSAKRDLGSGSTQASYVDAVSEQPTEGSSMQLNSVLKRPLGGVFSNITIRKQRKRSFPSRHLSPIKQSPIIPSQPRHSLQEDMEDDKADDVGSPSTPTNDMTTLSLSESEWMCRTPSPVRKDPEYERLSKLRSPGVDSHSFRNTLDGSVLRKKLAVLDENSDLEDSVMGRGDCEVKMRSGNWI